MIVGLKSFLNFTIGAVDGEIGTIKEMFFDDRSWTVRYIVAETGRWLPGRIVLLPPQTLTHLDWDDAVYQTRMSMEQIKKSPRVDSKPPVHVQEQVKSEDQSLKNYWFGIAGAGVLMPSPHVIKSEQERQESQLQDFDDHLRSSNEVTGYHIHAKDGEIGRVDDFILNTTTWKIESLIMETGSWLSKRKLMLSPSQITDISYPTARIIVDATVEQIRHNTEFDDRSPINVVYEKNLRDYYGRLITR